MENNFYQTLWGAIPGKAKKGLGVAALVGAIGLTTCLGVSEHRNLPNLESVSLLPSEETSPTLLIAVSEDYTLRTSSQENYTSSTSTLSDTVSEDEPNIKTIRTARVYR